MIHMTFLFKIKRLAYSYRLKIRYDTSYTYQKWLRNSASLTKSGLSQYSILPVKIKAYGKVFITSSCTLDGIYYQWVKLLGSPSEAKDFLFSLEYKGPKCTHVFLGEVASINETLDEMISSGKCSSIGFTTFKNQFMEGNTSKYHWSITVKRFGE